MLTDGGSHEFSLILSLPFVSNVMIVEHPFKVNTSSYTLICQKMVLCDMQRKATRVEKEQIRLTKSVC